MDLLQRSTSSAQDDQLVEKLLDAFEETPSDLVCPISQDIMIDPVVVSSGHTFDRESVLDEHGQLRISVCPLTRAELQPFVFPCHVVKERSVALRLSRLKELVATAELVLNGSVLLDTDQSVKSSRVKRSLICFRRCLQTLIGPFQLMSKQILQ